MRKRIEIGLEKMLSTLMNISRYWKKKRKMENELRIFKLDFAKMVFAKEEALSQLVKTK